MCNDSEDSSETDSKDSSETDSEDSSETDSEDSSETDPTAAQLGNHNLNTQSHYEAARAAFQQKWPELKSWIERIMTMQQFTRPNWQDCITQVYNLSIFNGYPLSHLIYEETEAFLQQFVVSRCQEIRNSADVLGRYEKSWNRYRDGIALLKQLLRCISRESVLASLIEVPGRHPEKKVLEIHDLCLDLWKQNVLHAMSDQLSRFLSEEIKNYMIGKCINSGAVRCVIKSLSEVAASNKDSSKVYRDVFEDRFLCDVREYYRIKADKEIQNYGCPQYIKNVLYWMNEEIVRVNELLHLSTIPKMKEQCWQILVVDRVEFLKTEFTKIVPQEVKTDYQNFYALLKQVENGFDGIVSEIEAYITRVGRSAMANISENNSELFVETFLEVREKYLNLIKECFDSDNKFIAALDIACVTILKCDGHKHFADKSAEVLAVYCDNVLKRESTTLDATYAEGKFSQAVTVLRYIEDKDIFQRLYSYMLSRRLLYGPAEMVCIEDIMITKLKESQSFEYAKQCSEMIEDISLNTFLNDEFSEFATAIDVKLELNFSVAVLRAPSWPLSGNTFPFRVPYVLEKFITAFETFCSKNNVYNGIKIFGKFYLANSFTECDRILIWLHHMSTAELKMCYLPETYFISVTTYQMAVLLLFEKADKLTRTEIKEGTELDEERLCEVLRSLTESKLLIKDDESIEDSNDGYHLNMKYSNKRLKFEIAAAARNEKKAVTPEEMQKVRRSAVDDREHAVNAAIVRVMKARKTLDHNSLIEEVIKKVSHNFVPETALIRRCIVGLIERKYLKQSTENQSRYEYVE